MHFISNDNFANSHEKAIWLIEFAAIQAAHVDPRYPQTTREPKKSHPAADGIPKGFGRDGANSWGISLSNTAARLVGNFAH